jgi:hypothetical protein
MARYKPYSYAQGKFIPIHFANQILPGTFEYTLNHLIDHELDLSVFHGKFKNDETGAPAYDPAILLKIVLFAYSRGIISSRRIAQACRENVIFMAQSADTRPHFTTIADFISGMDREIVHLFLEVLLVCDEQGLIGKGGKPIKSNITDNESAKMKTSKGVIQGYVGVTAVDSANQVIVATEAFGQGQEHDLLEPMVNGVRSNYKNIGKEENVFDHAKLTADSGFHSERNMRMLAKNEIDGYVADNLFRKRDPRFADYDRYKERSKKERAAREGRLGLFRPADFTFAGDLSHCICPAGKRLYRSGRNIEYKGLRSVRFKGPKSACVPCHLRTKCLRHPDRTEIRQVAYFLGQSKAGKNSFTARMRRKIDSAAGRAIYSMRLAVGEPPFAHIRSIMKLDRFTLRGKTKVDVQWKFFCIVHNLKKVYRHGEGFA